MTLIPLIDLSTRFAVGYVEGRIVAAYCYVIETNRIGNLGPYATRVLIISRVDFYGTSRFMFDDVIILSSFSPL